VEQQLWNYAYLNAGLRINYNGKTFVSKNGLLDLLRKKPATEETSVTPLFTCAAKTC
jgi:topoisomerase-4 subunit B